MWWRELDVSAPDAEVWALLTDTSRWPDWGPTVRAARLDHPGATIAAGSTGAVRTPVGVWLPFEVTAYDDRARTWSWRVAGVAATSHRVQTTGPGSCRVGFGVPWWAPAYLAVCERGLRRVRTLAEGPGS
ncbi:MAG: SRPBCC family protein [Nocardioides sp.]